MPRIPDYRKNRTIGDVISDIRRPHPIMDTAWYKAGPSEVHGINFATGASWHNVTGDSGAVNPLSWYANTEGEVRLRGRITGGVSGDLVMTLPEELRPEFDAYFNVETDEDGEFTFDGIKFRSYQTPDDTTGTDE